MPCLSTGVGFARMESREKCEQIIQIFNGTQLQGAKDPLLVKFADGGSKKKNNFKSPDPNARTWRDVAEGVPVTYDPSMQQNGIGVNVGTHIGVPAYSRYGAPQVGGFAMPGYMPGYMMATQPLQQVDEQVNKRIHLFNKLDIKKNCFIFSTCMLHHRLALELHTSPIPFNHVEYQW